MIRPTSLDFCIVVVMGVSGSGKSTVAAQIAEAVQWTFVDGDDLHPPSNVSKMTSGIPLNDADRLPWLVSITDWIQTRDRAGVNAVIACSALKRSHRDVLRQGSSRVRFLCLTTSLEILNTRLRARTGHFMQAAMLASQLETFEPLQADEAGITLDARSDVSDLVPQALAHIRRWASS
jgi:gluconokinase